ncbi:MAG TPA: UPF0223 family protein [Tetragenococcus sp.]|nr:UPF0223 family protein [Tetragenococcus sp.]
MKENYQYPLDLNWTTEEIVKVVDLYQALEDAYEKGIDNKEFLEKYQAFKSVAKSVGEQRRLGREFEELTGYSLYHTLATAKNNSFKKLKMKGE